MSQIDLIWRTCHYGIYSGTPLYKKGSPPFINFTLLLNLWFQQ